MARHIPAIAIVGELDADKKHILDKLEEHFTKEGYTVGIAADMANKLRANSPEPEERMGRERFREYVLQLTIDEERRVRDELSPAEKPLMFVCRGAMDIAAWLEPEALEQVWDREGYSPTHLRDARYDGVLHLHSRDPRIQTEDDRTCNAWMGARHMGLVAHTLSMDERINRAIAWSASFISGIEHEKRWLIASTFDRSRLPSPSRCIIIQQTYVRLPGEMKDHRYRIRGEDKTFLFFKTLKRKTGLMSAIDIESLIDEQTYVSHLFQYQVPGYATVAKDRICSVGNLHYYEHDFLRDLPVQILEAEVPTPDYAVDLPPWINPDEATDITGLSGFSNRDFSRQIAANKLQAA